jgi:hypothetical protein
MTDNMKVRSSRDNTEVCSLKTLQKFSHLKFYHGYHEDQRKAAFIILQQTHCYWKNDAHQYINLIKIQRDLYFNQIDQYIYICTRNINYVKTKMCLLISTPWI